jgi:hypothetical protein
MSQAARAQRTSSSESPAMDDLTPDVNRIVTELIKDFAGSFWDRAKSLTGDQITKLKVAFKVGFDGYLRDTIKRTSYVKTLLYRDKNIHISNMYVQTTFIQHDRMFSEPEFFAELENTKRCIITGNAGSGKSIFMKHATLHFISRE